MSAEVVTLPGVERHDIGWHVEVEKIFEDARRAGMITVVICGYGREGFHVWASHPDMDRNIGMIERAKSEIVRCDTPERFRNEPVE